jgi:hypothetical protein
LGGLANATVTAILVLAIGLAHLALAGRGLFHLDWLIETAVQRARWTANPMVDWSHWRLVANLALAWFVAVGATATVCGVGMLRHSDVARRGWLVASALVVPFYSIGFVRYLRTDFLPCTVGVVAGLALGASCYLLTAPGRGRFVSDADAT